MSQADFLSLLVTQMRNQDPTKPTDTSQMVSQLAQISQVSATQGLQTSFDSLSQSLQGNQLLQASSMVGRSVVVPSAVGSLQDGGMDGAVNVPDGGAAVLVQVTDAAGDVLRTISLGTPGRGWLLSTGTARATMAARFPTVLMGSRPKPATLRWTPT